MSSEQPVPEAVEPSDDHYRAKIRIGLNALAALAVLTAVEYLIATNVDAALVWMLPIAVAKGWLILDRFMHVRQLGKEHS